MFSMMISDIAFLLYGKVLATPDRASNGGEITALELVDQDPTLLSLFIIITLSLMTVFPIYPVI